jgi:hypothetical protein
VFVLAGCQNLTGPFAARRPERVDDPLYTIAEQQRRGRANLALPDESANLAPRTRVETPGVHGR